MYRNSVIIAIVEGDGEEEAVPQLIRRILWDRLVRYDVHVPRPVIAKGTTKFNKKWEQFLRYAVKKECDGILVLMDADEKCPYEEAQSLAMKASALGLNVPIAIVYAKSEYETWFISSLSAHTGQGIRERLGLDSSINAPDHVEDIRGAKEWLGRRMPRARGYNETSDQVVLTRHIDLATTRCVSRSFRRLCHAVEELVEAIDNTLSIVTPN